MSERLEPQLRTVGELFDASSTYTVPIYQRNFAWEAEHIHQLIDDISRAFDDGEESYFLGNLIVTPHSTPSTPSPSPPDVTEYEVIDGQQRLTTLYLILTRLARGSTDQRLRGHVGRLAYGSRPRARTSLARIDSGASGTAGDDASDPSIDEAFRIIDQHPLVRTQSGSADAALATYILDRVHMVRASLPRSTDINRYFEVMNTRGQQLEPVDIVKARLMSRLPDEVDRACFARVWDACAQMNTYVQVPLTPQDHELRTRVFGADWSALRPKSFSELRDALHLDPPGDDAPVTDRVPSSALTLTEAIDHYAQRCNDHPDEEPDTERFQSIIDFPDLLLHTLKVLTDPRGEHEGHLDDGRLIHRFTVAFDGRDSAAVKRFVFTLLKARVLFDALILKREFADHTGADGDWSLRKLGVSHVEQQLHPSYPATFAADDGQAPGVGCDARVLLLQSMLRVTFTSAQAMHWITLVLHEFVDADPADVAPEQVIELLEKYARAKVRDAIGSAGAEIGSALPEGFTLRRIVFTYLDYLLVREELVRIPHFRFGFRTSIEHFYPQQPHEEQSGAAVADARLNWFGNLALVSVGVNSKFGNSLPMSKATNYRDTIEEQSPKLALMARMTRERQSWSDVEVEAHHHHMRRLLETELRLP